jgi:hypothetical protein
MAGAPKDDLEALWERNRMLREKALGGKLSSQEVQSLPLQLRWPVKLHGFERPKGLRGPALVKWLTFQGGIWQDKRFGDLIDALYEHGLVDLDTHEFTDQQGPPELDTDNEYQQARCLEEVRARIGPDKSKRQACREVAAEWALGNSHEAGWRWLSDQLRPPKK